jgi:hypothetical protein
MQLMPHLVRAAEWAGRNAETLTKVALAAAALSAAIVTLNAGIKAYRTVTEAAQIASKLWSKATSADTLAKLKNTAAIVASTAKTVANRIAITAAAVAQRAIRLASIAWTAVQWLLNAALTANPLGLLIAAIALLIAGVVLAYKKSDKFRAIIDAVATVIKNVAIGAFNKLKSAIGWVVDKVQALWDKLMAVKNALAGGISSLLGAVGLGKTIGLSHEIAVIGRSGRSGRSGSRSELGLSPVIHIHGALDPDAVARQVSTILHDRHVRIGAPSRSWALL